MNNVARSAASASLVCGVLLVTVGVAQNRPLMAIAGIFNLIMFSLRVTATEKK